MQCKCLFSHFVHVIICKMLTMLQQKITGVLARNEITLECVMKQKPGDSTGQTRKTVQRYLPRCKYSISCISKQRHKCALVPCTLPWRVLKLAHKKVSNLTQTPLKYRCYLYANAWCYKISSSKIVDVFSSKIDKLISEPLSFFIDN